VSEPPRPQEPDEAAAVDAVLEGRDDIKLEKDLLSDGSAPAAAPESESIFIRIRNLSVAARVKLALTGGKEARQILTRDATKLVQSCVMRNPRITPEEVLTIAKNRSAHEEMLRTIADHRDWLRYYQVRLALVLNPKTPLPVALRLLSGLQERDVRLIAKSRNISTVLQAQAKRAVLKRGETI
jgi:hypothetical protein